jgi:hypothetical protein
VATETLGLYPHSAPDGTPIPFDIVRPLGLIRQDFTAVASAEIAIPTNAELLLLMATQECLMQLDGVVAIPANGVHTLGLIAIPGATAVVIEPNGALTFSVIRLGSDDGTLYVQTITKWKDLRKTAQFNRG